MARIGLGKKWKCVFANDWDSKKTASYIKNFPDENIFVSKDVAKIKTSDLPGTPDLIWASFPCQDLSLAGSRNGLQGERSGTLWPFWNLICDLAAEKRKPRIIVLENVVGALTSHSGKDFIAICKAVVSEGYKIGAIVIDAVHFIPQSRPRLFIVAVEDGTIIPDELQSNIPLDIHHPRRIMQAYQLLPQNLQKNWIWWRLPDLPERKKTLQSIIESNPVGIRWHTREETDRLLSLMSDTNLNKVNRVLSKSDLQIGCVYKRTRKVNGSKVQRAEVRFDGISGCLRTPAGGSSRQTVIIFKNGEIRSRLLSPRETARLMGVPDDYILPGKYNEAYHLMGDGLVVPVVSWLETHLLRPLLSNYSQNQ